MSTWRRILGWLSQPILLSMVVGGVASTPLFVAPGNDSPLGRPWYVERLIAVAVLLAALIWTLSRSKDPELRRRRTSLYPVVLALMAYGVFVANYATISSGDNLPTRALPRALLRGEGFDLSDVVPSGLHNHYSLIATESGLTSSFPLGTGLLATPYYFVAERIEADFGDMEGRSEARLEKHAAALMTTLALLALYFASRSLLPSPEHRLAAGLIVALGSPILLSVSQGLWSHTGEFLCLAVACWALSAEPSLGRALVAGLSVGLAFLCRPTALIVSPALIGFSPSTRPRKLIPFAISVFFTICIVCGINALVFGHPLGAYGRMNSGSRAWDPQGYLARLGGLLASPSRGLIWFFPALVVALVILAASIRRTDRDSRIKAFAACIPVFAIPLLTANFRNWWGGYSVGPRLLAELVLPAVILVALALRQRTLRPLLFSATLLQLVVHLGLYSSERARNWNSVVDVDRNPGVLFSLSDSQLAAAFVPDWAYEPPSKEYFQTDRPPDRLSVLRTPVDISKQTNADSGSWRRDPSLPSDSHLYLPRLTASNASKGLHFGYRIEPPGSLNTIRICPGQSTTIPLQGVPRFRFLSGILVWRGAEEPEDPMVGILYVHRGDGFVEVRGLRLGEEVFDPATALAPPGHRIVAGRWRDYDELVQTEFSFSERTSYEQVLIEMAPNSPPGCLYVLALSVR